MASWEDPWEVLGLSEDATQKEVESSFRKKALSCHPDRHPDDPTARAKFDRLSRAKETLLDPAKREAAEYHRKHGCDPPRPGEELQQRKGPAPGEWMEGRGFRARAPDERKRAENERIQKADEENFKRYQAQRRAQAQEYLRESTGGQLGGGAAGGLQEARQAFAQRLEQESDPKARRRQRAEEEKRQREAERQQRAEEERKRLQAWNERERARASRTRDVNEAKLRHWQSFGGGAQDVGADASSDPMVGTWLYGKTPNEYHIVQRPDGSLCFDGPCPAGAGRLRGALKPVDEWHEAEITFGDGELFGTMCFIFVSGEDGEEGLISQCRKAGSEDWGREVFARRARRRGSGGGPGEPSSPSAAGASGACASTAGDGEATPAEAAQSCGAPASPPAQGGGPPEPGVASGVGGELRITVTVDQALGFSTEVVVPRGTTVLQLKERLAADDPTGSTVASGFGLAAAGAAGLPLPDETVLTELHGTLDICPLTQEPATPESALLAWLKGIRLEAYHDAILEQGFEQLDDLKEAPVARVEELAGLTGMKLGHAVRFRKAAKDLAGATG